MINKILVNSFIVFLLFAVQANAAVIFEDNFDSITWNADGTKDGTECGGSDIPCSGSSVPPTGWTGYRSNAPVTGHAIAITTPPTGPDHTTGSGHVLVARYPTAGYSGDSLLGKMISTSTQYPEIYVQFWFRWQTGGTSPEGAGMKFFRATMYETNYTNFFEFTSAGWAGPTNYFNICQGYPNDVNHGGYGLHYRCDPQATQFYCGAHPPTNDGVNMNWPGGGSVSATWGNGSWHRVKIHLKMNTSAGSTNGIQQTWIDGTLVNDLSNVSWRESGTNATGWNSIYLGGNTGGNSTETWVAFDDIVVSTTDIADNYVPGGSGADTTAPTTTASPAAGTYTGAQSVALSCSDNVACSTTQYCTGAACTPSTNYTGAISVSATTTLRYRSTDAVPNTETIKESVYTINAGTSVTTVDTNASQLTKNVLQYLTDLDTGTSNRIISGQYTERMNATTSGCNSGSVNCDDTLDIYNDTGKYVGLAMVDWTFSSITNTQVINYATANGARTNGFVMVGTHFNNFATCSTTCSGSGAGTAWDTGTIPNITSLTTAGNAQNTKLNNWLDTLATRFAAFESANVVVLFRPLHEMNGSWFWWNGLGTTNYKTLWNYVVNYMNVTKGLHNILWTWSPNGSLESAWYPGTTKADIVSVDLYGVLSPSAVSGYSELATTYSNKPFMLGEWGVCAGGLYQSGCSSQNISSFITGLKSGMPKTIAWAAWNNVYSMAYHSGVSTILNDAWVVNRDELPTFLTATPPAAPRQPKNLVGKIIEDKIILQ